jgi:hypothetical protein
VNIIFKLNQIEQFNSYSHLLQINFVENDISGKSFISFLIFVSLCRSLQKHYTSENYRQVRFLSSQIGSFFNEFWILDTFLQPIIPSFILTSNFEHLGDDYLFGWFFENNIRKFCLSFVF